MSGKSRHDAEDFQALIDRACDALEAAWQSGRTPEWNTFIVGNCADEQYSCCVELVAVDMEWRHKANLPARAEDYLALVPGEPPASVRASIVVQEYAIRRRLGEILAPEEYLSRFPELSDVLSTMFQEDTSNSNHQASPDRHGKLMKPTAKELSDRLSDSGILDAEQVDRLREAAGLTSETASGETLAKLLVKQGKLTKFQAQLA